MPSIGDIKRNGKWSTKHIWAQCPICLKERWMRLSNYRRGSETGLCLKCFNDTRTKNVGELRHDGYVLIRRSNHPRAHYGMGRYIKRAVLVAEAKLGRCLFSTEHIHHINGIRDDDRPENIMILTNSEHSRLHRLKIA